MMSLPADGSGGGGIQGNRESHADQLHTFWERVTTTNDRLVLWWGRRSPRDYSFYLALAARLIDRPFDAIDVTGAQYTFTAHDGTHILSQPAQEVSTIRHEGLKQLFDTQAPVSASQRELSATKWRQLCRENAAFRILSEAELISAPLDYFDSFILSHVPSGWRPLHQVLWDVYTHQLNHSRVSSGMIWMRLAAMVNDGRVMTDKHPFNIRNSSVRLPASH